MDASGAAHITANVTRVKQNERDPARSIDCIIWMTLAKRTEDGTYQFLGTRKLASADSTSVVPGLVAKFTAVTEESGSSPAQTIGTAVVQLHDGTEHKTTTMMIPEAVIPLTKMTRGTCQSAHKNRFECGGKLRLQCPSRSIGFSVVACRPETTDVSSAHLEHENFNSVVETEWPCETSFVYGWPLLGVDVYDRGGGPDGGIEKLAVSLFYRALVLLSCPINAISDTHDVYTKTFRRFCGAQTDAKSTPAGGTAGASVHPPKHQPLKTDGTTAGMVKRLYNFLKHPSSNDGFATIQKTILDTLLVAWIQGAAGEYHSETEDDRGNIYVKLGKNCDCDDCAVTGIHFAHALRVHGAAMRDHGLAYVGAFPALGYHSEIIWLMYKTHDHLVENYGKGCVVLGHSRSPSNPKSGTFGHAWMALSKRGASRSDFTGALPIETTAPVCYLTAEYIALDIPIGVFFPAVSDAQTITENVTRTKSKGGILKKQEKAALYSGVRHLPLDWYYPGFTCAIFEDAFVSVESTRSKPPNRAPDAGFVDMFGKSNTRDCRKASAYSVSWKDVLSEDYSHTLAESPQPPKDDITKHWESLRTALYHRSGDTVCPSHISEWIKARIFLQDVGAAWDVSGIDRAEINEREIPVVMFDTLHALALAPP